MMNNAYDSALATTTAAPRIHVYTIQTMTVGTPVLPSIDYRVDGATQTLTRTSGGLGNGNFENFSTANYTSVVTGRDGIRGGGAVLRPGAQRQRADGGRGGAEDALRNHAVGPIRAAASGQLRFRAAPRRPTRARPASNPTSTPQESAGSPEPTAQPYVGPSSDASGTLAAVFGSVFARSSSMSGTPSPSLSVMSAESPSSAVGTVSCEAVKPCASIDTPNGVCTLPDPVVPWM